MSLHVGHSLQLTMVLHSFLQSLLSIIRPLKMAHKGVVFASYSFATRYDNTTKIKCTECCYKLIIEMELVGNKNASVELLFNCLQARKHKVWTQVHEELVNKLLGLCVELRNTPLAKETLHHYRNISQQQVRIKSFE